MTNLINKSKGPGVYIPPPLFYVLIFIAAIFIQKNVPISDTLFHSMATKVTGAILILVSLFFLVRSLRQFFLTKNTLVLIRPASSLQTTGIYGITRNPNVCGISVCLFRNYLFHRKLVEYYSFTLCVSNYAGIHYQTRRKIFST